MSPFCGEDTEEEEHLIQTVQEIKVDTTLFEDKVSGQTLYKHWKKSFLINDRKFPLKM